MDNPFVYIPETMTENFIVPNTIEWKGNNAKTKIGKWAVGKVYDLLVKYGFLGNKVEYRKHIVMNTTTLNLDKLDEQIARNKVAIEAVYYNRVDTIIVGADIMLKLLKDPYRMGQVDVNLNMESKYAGYGNQRLVYRNLRVILVPWFEGFLLLKNDEGVHH